MGKPNFSTMARGIAAWNTQGHVAVPAVERNGSREPAWSINVNGPGQKRSAKRSNRASRFRARP